MGMGMNVKAHILHAPGREVLEPVVRVHELRDLLLADAQGDHDVVLVQALGGTTCLNSACLIQASCVFYGITCLIRLFEFAKFVTTFEENLR